MQNKEVWENSKHLKYLKEKEILKNNFKNVFSNMQKGSDLWLTPVYGVEIILPYLKKYQNKIVWCPFDTKESNFVKILKKHNFNVVYSHLENDQDFFKYEPKYWDLIVSNPPWSIKDKVLKRCYQLNKPFALILPIHAISGKFRYSLFKKNKLQLLTSQNRICFEGVASKNNRPPFESAYFCYNFLPESICHEK